MLSFSKKLDWAIYALLLTIQLTPQAATLSADGGDGIHVLAKSLSTIDAINRDQGLLGGRYAKLIKQDQGGSFIANQGQIDFSGLLSPVAVKRWGGQFQAANGVTINDSDDLNNGGTLSEDEVDPDGLGPSKDSPLSSSSLGLTGSLIESIFQDYWQC